MENYNKIKNKVVQNNPARLILLMYIVVIAIGSLLLVLPISSNSRQWTSLMDASFTVVSATCVTGLVTVVTAAHWSLFGKIVILLLIQLGGLGVMTAASIVSLLFNKKMSIKDRIYLSEEKGMFTIAGIIKLVKFILITTFIIEFAGAVFLMFTFIPQFGFMKGFWYSIFHAISAFCNAGFDILGDSSLVPYALNVNVSMVISLLIIIGGIGHKVIAEFLEKKFRFKEYSLHSKLVLMITTTLLILPTVFFIIIEWNNPETLGNYGFFEKILTAFFQSATLRTAGFASTNQAAYTTSSILLMLVLMFIGGSPAGTAGGFKTTSFLSLFLVTKANIKQEKEISLMKRSISSDLVGKIISLFTVSLAWIFLAVLLITISDKAFNLIDILFEVFSAYGTVGLTRGITPFMSNFAKIVIMATMLFGKVGPLSLFIAFTNKANPKTYKLREEEILIG